jgi:hypothetical protein
MNGNGVLIPRRSKAAVRSTADTTAQITQTEARNSNTLGILMGYLQVVRLTVTFQLPAENSNLGFRERTNRSVKIITTKIHQSKAGQLETIVRQSVSAVFFLAQQPFVFDVLALQTIIL